MESTFPNIGEVEFLGIDDEDNIEIPPLPHLMKFMKYRKDENKNLDLFDLMGGGGSQLLIPRDIFHLIMSFIPAFPDYFILRFVSSQWLYEFEEHIFARVEYLSLVEDGKPNYYFRVDGSGQKSLVQLKPISLVGRKGQSQCSLSCDEMPNEDTYDESILEVSTNMVLMLFESLVMVFPNVKHLRLGLSFIDFSHFNPEILLQRLTQLETLDILGIVNYRPIASYNFLEYNQLEMIADSLPSSTKNLNFIGVTFFDMDAVAMLKIFSSKGRSSMTNRKYPPPAVDIQNLSLSYLFVELGQLHRDDLKSIEEMYLHLEVSVVELTSSTDSSSPPVEVVSYVDYLNYMSKKEGVVLSHMKMLRRDNDEIKEAVIDIAIREYPYFQPLLSLPVSEQFQLVSQTKLDVKFILDANRLYLPKVLEILTDPSRMKYPELVFKMDSMVVERKSTPITLLSSLISECFSEQGFNLIKRIIETYKPSMAVNGVRNYLFETFLNNDRFSLIRTKLMRYLLSVEPELITLGDLDGIINGDQRSLPLIATLIDQNAWRCLQMTRFLVSAGASLTQVDRNGNTVLHSACKAVDIDLVKYLVSVCPESLMSKRNNMGQTPLEQTFLNYDRDPLFLEEVVNLPYFKNRTLQDYETSCGNLLHVAMKYGYRDSILWFIKHGFDVNAPNEKGENTLFCCLSSQRKYHFDYMCDTQAEYVDEFAVKLIEAGAQVDVENNEGDTIVTSALRNKNYRLINTLIQTQSASPKVFSKILAPRMKHGLNALHYSVKKMVSVVGSIQLDYVDNEMRIFHLSDYPVAKHCALLCLEHHPEMLYERSEASDEKTLKHICDVSPLQILLRARHGLYLLNELSIKLSDIANQPVFKSKDSDVTAPIPLMYLASEHIGRTIIIPMFEELMNYTDSESKQMVQQLLEKRDTKNREKKRLKRKTSSDTDGSSELLTSEQNKKRRTNQF